MYNLQLLLLLLLLQPAGTMATAAAVKSFMLALDSMFTADQQAMLSAAGSVLQQVSKMIVPNSERLSKATFKKLVGEMQVRLNKHLMLRFHNVSKPACSSCS